MDFRRSAHPADGFFRVACIARSTMSTATVLPSGSCRARKPGIRARVASYRSYGPQSETHAASRCSAVAAREARYPPKQTEASTALLAGCSAYVRFGWEHPARYRLMFAASGFAPNALETFTLIEETIARCVRAGTSASDDPHRDTFLVWAGLHGIATLEKPARPDYRRLGLVDRPAAVALITRRLARLTTV